MSTKVIPLTDLQANVERLLNDCCDTGSPLVVEMPDHRLISIQPVEQDDDLVDRLIAQNPRFQELLSKSAAGPCKPFFGITETPSDIPPRSHRG